MRRPKQLLVSRHKRDWCRADARGKRQIRCQVNRVQGCEAVLVDERACRLDDNFGRVLSDKNRFQVLLKNIKQPIRRRRGHVTCTLTAPEGGLYFDLR